MTGTEKPKSDLPIRSQDVRKLTDEETERIAKGFLEDVKLSESEEVTWEDIERVAKAVLSPKPKKP